MVLEAGEQLVHAPLLVGDQVAALVVVGLGDGVRDAVDVLHQARDAGQQRGLLVGRGDRARSASQQSRPPRR